MVDNTTTKHTFSGSKCTVHSTTAVSSVVVRDGKIAVAVAGDGDGVVIIFAV